MRAFEHPVAAHRLAQLRAGRGVGVRIGQVRADRLQPVPGTVLHPRDRETVAIAEHVAADHREAEHAVLQEAQVALALVEAVLLQRRQGEIEVEAGQVGGIAFDLHPGWYSRT